MNKIDSVLRLRKDSRSPGYFKVLKDYLTFDNPAATHFKVLDKPVPEDIPLTIKLYQETKYYYVFPRSLLYHFVQEGDKSVRYAGQNSDVEVDLSYGSRHFEYESKLVPRAGQLEAIEYIHKRLSSPGCYGGILHAATGRGKSIISIAIAGKLGKPTLIVAYRKHLLHNFEKAIGLIYPEATIGYLGGGKKDSGSDADFILTTPQSLLSKKQDLDQEYKDTFGTIILDETHVFGSPKEWVKVLTMFRAKYRLGLTATLERTDGLERIYQAHIGPVLYELLAPPLYADVYMSDHTYDKPYKLKKYPGAKREDYGTILKRIGQDTEYLKKVSGQVIGAASAGRKVLVLGMRKAHLRTIYDQVIKKNVRAVVYDGSDAFDKVDIDKYDVILSTVSKSGVGFDVPRVDTLVIVDPMKTVSQVVGRVLRPVEGKPRPIVIDNYYCNSPQGYNQARGREEFYRRAGHTIKRAIR